MGLIIDFPYTSLVNPQVEYVIRQVAPNDGGVYYLIVSTENGKDEEILEHDKIIDMDKAIKFIVKLEMEQIDKL